MKKNITLLFIILTFFLMDCGSGIETIQVDLQSEENANSGNAVVLTIYQLTSADKFRLSSFESLKNPEAALGTDLVANSIMEKTMVPGKKYNLNEIEIKEETAFLGVVADFHSPAPEGWKQIIPMNEDFDKLIISVQENSVTFKIED